MRILPVSAAAVLVLAYAGTARAQWQPIATAAPFSADTAMLLTDGTVMVHALSAPDEYGSNKWYRLTPDIDGSYVSGTWSELAHLPKGYAPLYFTSAVLPDGRVIVEGGEYNEKATAETTLGAIYDPTTNKWTSVAPPSGWTSIGDAPSVVLGDGTLLMGSSFSSQQALFDATTLTWTATGTGKADANSEEGFTLLPDGKVLTVDVSNEAQAVNAELYDPTTGTWSGAGNTGVPLVDAGEEVGPSLLLEDGNVFAIGATGNTAIFHPAQGSNPLSWSTGPTFPVVSGAQLDAADAPAALLPNGDVLCIVSPQDYQPPVHVFTYDGKALTEVTQPAGATAISSYNVRLLVLPTGEVLYLDGTSAPQIFTGTGSPKASWAPTITQVPKSLKPKTTYMLHGTQLNGRSAGAAYGDDAQMATNYPIVRITNVATGHVFYARTHDHSTMAVATGSAVVTTKFDIAAATETGASMLEVIANGIASAAERVTIE